MSFNYKGFQRAKAIENANKRKLLALFPHLEERSGIYILLRTNEEGVKYAYVGQAKKVLTRLAQHLVVKKKDPQHIDLSIHTHGLKTESNPFGWQAQCVYYGEEQLNEKERWWIAKVIEDGFIVHNKTVGGQDKGKVGLNENKPAKGYYDGLKQGYVNCQREVQKMFKYLTFDIDGKPNKIKERYLEKFKDFLKGEQQNET